MAAAKYGSASYDLVSRDDTSFILGHDSEANSINIKENSNENKKSFTYVQKGYFKDTQGTGLEHFAEN